MDNSVWRIWAKMVAYVELVLLCLSLHGLIYMVSVTSSAGVINDPKAMEEFRKQGISDEDAEATKSNLSIAAWDLWAALAIYGVATGTQMWAAIKLLGSSELGVSPAEAVAKARIWRNVAIVFFVLGILGGIISMSWIPILITILWRGGSLFVVVNFIKELEFFMTTQSGGVNNPVGVIISN